MARINISGLGEPFDGSYDLVVPTTTDQKLFRKAADIDPGEMTQILASGAVESFALVVFSSIRRAGKTLDGVTDGLVDRLLDLPMDILTAAVAEVEEEPGDAAVPPVSVPAEPV